MWSFEEMDKFLKLCRNLKSYGLEVLDCLDQTDYVKDLKNRLNSATIWNEIFDISILVMKEQIKQLEEKGCINMGIKENKIELVKSEDVVQEQKAEFKPGSHVTNILMRGRKNMANMFDNLGFKGFEFVHPRHGYMVNFFVKGDVVAMIDYHGSNSLVVEILNEEEREWFMESVGEHLGSEEVKMLRNMGKLKEKGDIEHGKD